jgi:putative copper resistance protein D
LTVDATLLLAAVRALHFASVVVLFGQFAYAWAVAPARTPPPGFRRIGAWSVVIALVTGLAWLAFEAVGMSGLPVKEALGASTLKVVVTQTLFGRVWLFRMALALALLFAFARLRPEERGGRMFTLAGVLSLLLLVSLAFCGHAAAGKGLDGAVHLCVDGLHLLAAASWLGALVPLISVLGRASAAGEAERVAATRRFSTLGIAAVCAILVSGVANTASTVGDFSSILDMRYGELLIAKVALFVVILAFAGVNRIVLMPHLDWRALRRNAIAECILGFCVIAIVGELGITVPAGHHHFHG